MSSHQPISIVNFFVDQLSTRQGAVKYAPLLLVAGIILVSGLLTLFRMISRRENNSAISSSLGHTPTAAEAKDAADKRFKKLGAVAYFLGVPAIFIVCVFCGIFISPKLGAVARKVLPSMFSGYDSSSIESLLPLHPKNFAEAYEYGRLFERYEGCSREFPPQSQQQQQQQQQEEKERCVRRVLEAAEELYSRSSSNRQKRAIAVPDLEQLAQTIRDLDSRKGPFQKLLSFFSLVGFLWFLSIVGICCFVVPFVGIVFGDLLYTVFVRTVLPLLTTIWETIIRPFGALFLYFFSFVALVESSRYPSDAYSLSGTMVAVLAVGFFAAGWVYATLQIDSAGGHFEAYMAISGAYHFVFVGMLAILHQSKLLAHLAVCALLVSVAFSFVTDSLFGILWTGLRRDNGITRVLAGSFFIQVLAAALSVVDDQQLMKVLTSDARNFGSTSFLIDPFRDSFALAGGTAFYWIFLLLVFLEDKHVDFIKTSLAYIAVGFFFDLPALMQLACFYLGAYVSIWVILTSFRKQGLILGGFVGSVLLFILANVLSNHSEFVTSMLLGQGASPPSPVS